MHAFARLLQTHVVSQAKCKIAVLHTIVAINQHAHVNHESQQVKIFLYKEAATLYR